MRGLTPQGFLDEGLAEGKPEGNPKAGLQYTPKGVQLTLAIALQLSGYPPIKNTQLWSV